MSGEGDEWRRRERGKRGGYDKGEVEEEFVQDHSEVMLHFGRGDIISQFCFLYIPKLLKPNEHFIERQDSNQIVFNSLCFLFLNYKK